MGMLIRKKTSICWLSSPMKTSWISLPRVIRRKAKNSSTTTGLHTCRRGLAGFAIGSHLVAVMLSFHNVSYASLRMLFLFFRALAIQFGHHPVCPGHAALPMYILVVEFHSFQDLV